MRMVLIEPPGARSPRPGRRAARLDFSIVRLDDAATDREAQPRSAVGAAARSVDAVKPVEQMRHRLRRNRRIRVLDHNAYLPGVATRHDPDATPGIGIAQRVLQQVAERL